MANLTEAELKGNFNFNKAELYPAGIYPRTYDNSDEKFIVAVIDVTADIRNADTDSQGKPDIKMQIRTFLNCTDLFKMKLYGGHTETDADVYVLGAADSKMEIIDRHRRDIPLRWNKRSPAVIKSGRDEFPVGDGRVTFDDAGKPEYVITTVGLAHFKVLNDKLDTVKPELMVLFRMKIEEEHLSIVEKYLEEKRVYDEKTAEEEQAKKKTRQLFDRFSEVVKEKEVEEFQTINKGTITKSGSCLVFRHYLGSTTLKEELYIPIANILSIEIGKYSVLWGKEKWDNIRSVCIRYAYSRGIIENQFKCETQEMRDTVFNSLLDMRNDKFTNGKNVEFTFVDVNTHYE